MLLFQYSDNSFLGYAHRKFQRRTCRKNTQQNRICSRRMDHGCVDFIHCHTCGEEICYHSWGVAVKRIVTKLNVEVRFDDVVRFTAALMKVFKEEELREISYCQRCIPERVTLLSIFSIN